MMEMKGSPELIQLILKGARQTALYFRENSFNSCRDTSLTTTACLPHGGTREEFTGSAISLGDIIWAGRISVSNSYIIIVNSDPSYSCRDISWKKENY